ncbi:MAG: hypothetical protein ACI9VX_001685 [Dinoroseobacter sp.]
MRRFLIAALEIIASRRVFFGFGAAGATQALSTFFGISLVVHSSGGMILTASSGYIAETFIGAATVGLIWLVMPFVVALGLILKFRLQILSVFDWAIRRLYFWRNPQ